MNGHDGSYSCPDTYTHFPTNIFLNGNFVPIFRVQNNPNTCVKIASGETVSRRQKGKSLTEEIEKSQGQSIFYAGDDGKPCG